MKKIFNILIVMLVVGLAFTSCDSEDSTSIPDTVLTTTKTVSFGQAETLVESSATAYSLPVVVSPSDFSGNYLIEYTVNGVGGSTSVTGGQAANISLDVSGPGTVYDIVIDRVTVIGTEVGVIDQSNNATTVKVINDRLTMELSWADASIDDLDFFVTDIDTFIVDDSQSTSAGEDIALPNATPDGTYRVFVRNWASTSDPIPFTIEVTYPDFSVEIFTGDIPNVARQFNEALTIVKTGSTYAITQLDPTVPL